MVHDQHNLKEVINLKSQIMQPICSKPSNGFLSQSKKSKFFQSPTWPPSSVISCYSPLLPHCYLSNVRTRRPLHWLFSSQKRSSSRHLHDLLLHLLLIPSNVPFLIRSSLTTLFKSEPCLPKPGTLHPPSELVLIFLHCICLHLLYMSIFIVYLSLVECKIMRVGTFVHCAQ